MNVNIENRAKMVNAQTRQRAQTENLQQSNYEEMINQQKKDVSSNMIQAGLANASEVLAGRLRDKEMGRVQEQTISMLGTSDFSYEKQADGTYRIVAHSGKFAGQTFDTDDDGLPKT